MPRQQNFFYQSPLPSITQSLGRALFGDPGAAQAQAKAQSEEAVRQAQAAKYTADAGYADSRTAGQTFQNSSSAGLGGLFSEFIRGQNPAAPEGADPLAALPAVDPQAQQMALGRIIAAIGGAQGDKIDTSETMGSLGAFLGGDELARRGMVAQGQTPGKDFAITPGRADIVRDDNQAASYDQATGVATINNRDDIPVANIQAQTARRGQDLTDSRGRRGQDIASGDRQRGQDLKGHDRAGAVSLGGQFGTVSSAVRTPEHNKAVGGVANSYHLESRGGRAIDIARKPGVTHGQVVDGYRAAGFTILEALDEGDHSHIALTGGPGAKEGKGGKADAAPKGITAAADTLIKNALNAIYLEKDFPESPRARSIIKGRAITLYQRTGNHQAAARQAFADGMANTKLNSRPGGANAAPASLAKMRADASDAIARGADPAAVAKRFHELNGTPLAPSGSRASPPVPGARRSPRDGLWYVQQGKHPDGSPAYARVDG